MRPTPDRPAAPSPSRLAVAAFAALVVLGASARPARAGNDSIVTLGIGSHSVVTREAGVADAPATTSYGQGVSLRLRLVYFLGIDASWESTGTTDHRNVATPSYQLSALLYLVPLPRASGYLIAGLGATSIGDLFSTSGSTSSYHAGVGLEVGVTKHWIVAAEYRVGLPTYDQAKTRMLDLVSRTGHAASIDSFYNFDTWSLTIGVRYYL